MRRTLLVVLAGLFAIGSAGCSEEPGAPAPKSYWKLVTSLEIRPVLEEMPGVPGTPCPPVKGQPSIPLRDGTECLVLAPPAMVVTEARDVSTTHQEGSGWVVNISFLDHDAKTWTELTTAHVGRRLAIVVGGTPVMAPTVQSAIAGGHTQIAGNFTQQQAEDLAHQLTG